MKYLHKFETQAQCEAYMNGSDYEEPFVGLVAATSEILYNKVVPQPLTFNITSPGTIKWTTSNTLLTKTISYSTDNGVTWTDITSNTGSSAPTININAGDKVMFKGDNATYATESYSFGTVYNSFSGSTAGFEVEGNIMSLIDSTGFATATTLASAYTFYYLFCNCTGLTSAENLVLPSTELSEYCYQNMFRGCTSLTTAPELPATTLTDSCYSSMFYNCTSLTTAPSLTATTLSSNCYYGMFRGCIGLTTAPALPATTLSHMCYCNMFSGCTSLATAPELPATKLTYAGYNEMFAGCTSLNYIKCLATDISESLCTNNWVEGVAATGTFVKNANMSRWETGTSGIPIGWTVQDAS
jgi:hypothetical protein